MSVLRQATALRGEAARLMTDFETRGIVLRHCLVTGSSGGEGVTSMTVALALAAQWLSRKPSLIVDASTQGKAIGATRGRTAKKGLRDLGEETDLDTAARHKAWEASFETLAPDVFLFPRGIRRDASLVDIASSGALEAFVDFTENRFCNVFWDTDPANSSLETKVLAAHIPNVILVTESDETRIDHFASTVRELETLNAQLAAVVRNRAGRRMFSVGANQQ